MDLPVHQELPKGVGQLVQQMGSNLLPPGERPAGYGKVILYVVAAGGLLVGLYVCRNAIKDTARKVLKHAANVFLFAGHEDASNARAVFNATPTPAARQAKNHTHPFSAGERTRATVFMSLYAAQMGREPYYVGQSKYHVRQGLDGVPLYRSLKNFQVEPRYAEMPLDRVQCFVDSDWWFEPEEIFGDRNADSIMVYTIMPESVAETSRDYSFCFDEAGRLDMRVSGGARYQHKLHNWGSSDHYTSVIWHWYGPRVVVYLSDVRQMSRHRSVVLLSREANWDYFSGWLAYLCVRAGVFEAETLVRLNPVTTSGWTVLRIRNSNTDGDEGDYTSLGRPNSQSSVEIPTAHFDACVDYLKQNGKMPNSVVMPMLTDDRTLERETRGKLWTLTGAINGVAEDESFEKYALGLRTHVYKPYVAGHTGLSKPITYPYMNALTDGSYAPDKSMESEAWAKQARIMDVRTSPNGALSSRMVMHMREFVGFLFPRAGMLDPAEPKDVYDHQDRPSQQAILRAAEGPTRSPNVLQTFQKGEVAGGLKPGRIITTVTGCQKMNYTRYTMILGKHMAEYSDCGQSGAWGGRVEPFYAFGRPCAEVARIVAGISCRATRLFLGDYNRMDGRVSDIGRMLERQAFMRGFPSSEHDSIQECLDYLIHAKTRMTSDEPRIKRGVHTPAELPNERLAGNALLDTAYARLSGEGGTAVLNSLETAFNEYHARRNCGADAKEAWQSLGLAAGDDSYVSLDRGLTPEAMLQAAVELGHVLTYEVAEYNRREDPDSTKPSFLSRYYGPDVWHGDEASICDIVRTLRQMNCTTRSHRALTQEQYFEEKLSGLRYSDANTPVISSLIALSDYDRVRNPGNYIELEETEIARLRNYTVRIGGLDTVGKYPNEYGDWMLGYVHQMLGTVNFDYYAFMDTVRRCYDCGSLLPLMEGPGFCAPVARTKPIVDCDVDGDYVEGEKRLDPYQNVRPEKSESDHLTESATACKYGQDCAGLTDGSCKYAHAEFTEIDWDADQGVLAWDTTRFPNTEPQQVAPAEEPLKGTLFVPSNPPGPDAGQPASPTFGPPPKRAPNAQDRAYPVRPSFLPPLPATASNTEATAKQASVPRTCHAWAAGRCTYGSKCKYAHPPNPTKEVCKNWGKGACKNGKDCYYLHEGPGGYAPGVDNRKKK